MGKTRRKNRPQKGLGIWDKNPYEVDDTENWDRKNIPKTWTKKKGKKKKIRRIEKLDDIDAHW